MRLAIVLAALVLVAACAPRTYVVLLEEEDGTTGQVSVSTDAGTTVIDQAGQGASFGSAGATPSAFAADTAQVEKDFAAAIGAQPEPPAKFVLYFLSDKTELKPASAEQLPSILDAIARRAAPDIAVVGHSDRYGDEAYNHRLALRRAQAIRDAIVARGIDAAAIDVASHGETDPLVPTPDDTREPRNRRVEVFVR